MSTITSPKFKLPKFFPRVTFKFPRRRVQPHNSDNDSSDFEYSKDYKFDMTNLPPHIMVNIFQYTPLRTLKSCGKVCKHWNESYTHPFVWKRYLKDVYTVMGDLELEEYVESERGNEDDNHHEINAIPNVNRTVKEYEEDCFKKYLDARMKYCNLLKRKNHRVYIRKKRETSNAIRRGMTKVNMIVYVILVVLFYAIFSFYVYFIAINYFLTKLFTFSYIVDAFPMAMLAVLVILLTCLYVYLMIHIYLKHCWPWKNKWYAVLKYIYVSFFFISLITFLLSSFLCSSYLENMLPHYVVSGSLFIFMTCLVILIYVFQFKYIARKLTENLAHFDDWKMKLWYAMFSLSILLSWMTNSLLVLSFWIPWEFPILKESLGLDWWFFLPMTLVADSFIVITLFSTKTLLGLQCSIYGIFVNVSFGVLGMGICKILLLFYQMLGDWIFFAALLPITSIASSSLYTILMIYYR